MVTASEDETTPHGISPSSKGPDPSRKGKRDPKKEKRVRTLIRNVKTLVKEAKSLGADVSKAKELIGRAESCLKDCNYKEIPSLVRSARQEATEAKRFFRAKRMIQNVLPLVDQADTMGADISEPLQFLREAQKSLQEKNFGLVSQNLRNVREAVKRAKRRRRSQETLDKMASTIEEAAEKHLDVSDAKTLFRKAESAFLEEKHVEVRKAYQKLRKVLSEAKLKKRMQDKLRTLQMDLEELKSMDVDITRGNRILEMAQMAMEEGRYAKMENLIKRGRRWITRERKKRETELLVNAVETLLEKASEGAMKQLDARSLMKTFKEAILSDKISDLEKIVQADLAAAEDEEKKKRAERRFLRFRNLVRDLQEYGEDTTGYEIIMREAQRALDEGNTAKAETLMEEIEKSESIRRLLRKRANHMFGKAKSSLMQARSLKMNTREMEELMLIAENLLGEERFLESMEKAKMVHQMAEKITPEEDIAKRRELEERLTHARLMLDESRRASIDVSFADEILEKAERATEEGKLRDAETMIAKVEKFGEELHSSLESASNQFISSLSKSLERMRAAGVSLPHLESLQENAESYHKEGRYQASIECANMAQKLLKEYEQSFENTAKENVGALRKGVEEVKASGINVKEAEVLLEDADAAIEKKEYGRYRLIVEKAEDSLREAEETYLSNRALRELEEIHSFIEEASSSGSARVDEARMVLKKAEEAYETKNWSIVSMLADTVREILGESRKRRLIQEFATKSKVIGDLIEDAEEAGIGIEEVRQLLRNAQERFGEDDYEAALRLIQRSEKAAHDVISKFIQERSPKVVVKLPPAPMEHGAWNKCMLELANEGDLAAKDVTVNLQGDIEVKGLKAVERLLPKERKKIQVGVKPQRDGKIPIDISLSFRKPLDKVKFEVKSSSDINICSFGTYLVDDVFLVHNDGRLILHESREYRDAVDEDIFSGMLTVMQDFVRDSFGKRAKTGLSRMDFGDNKVVIERGHFVYLAAVLTGEEPVLLPLYMAEIVKEIEEKFGDVLEDWSGLLSELEGIEETVRKIIFVSDDEEADIGDLEASVITSTLQMLKEAENAGADVTQAQNLLQRAKELLEEQDYETAWRCVEDAAQIASETKARLRGQLENALSSAKTSIEEAKSLGLKVKRAEHLLGRATDALERFDLDEVNLVVKEIQEVVDNAKSGEREESTEREIEATRSIIDQLKKEGTPIDRGEDILEEATQACLNKDFARVEECLVELRRRISNARGRAEKSVSKSEISELRLLIENAREAGLNVSDAENKLKLAEEAGEHGKTDLGKKLAREARKLLQTAEQNISPSEASRYVERIKSMVEEADALGIKIEASKQLIPELGKVDLENMMKDLPRLLEVEKEATRMIAEYLDTGSPDIRIDLPTMGLQADVWNRFLFEIENQGNMAARNIDIELSGDFEIRGLERIAHLDPKEKREIEVGLKPAREGDTRINTRIYYQRYFDEDKYKLEDLQQVRVEAPGTYLVEDVFLIHRDGRLIAHETRKYREEIDEDVFSGMLSVVQDFVRDSFKSKNNVGLKRLDFGESKILMECGKYVSIAAVLVGQEPVLLPLRILEVIAKIEEVYGETLAGWTGLMSDLPGIADYIKELIFVTDKADRIPDGLKSSFVGKISEMDDAYSIIQEARRMLETEGLDATWKFVSDILGTQALDEEKGRMAYPEITLSPEFIKELGDLAESPEFRTHVAMISEIIHVVGQVRSEVGLGQRMPINCVAIKPADQETADVISDFKRVLQDHLRAKELILVPPDQEWEGLDLEIIVDEDLIEETYPQWSTKISMLLRSQSPWKIKAGLDKGSYGVGIEGQKVFLDPQMVSYKVSVPDHISELEFSRGKIYLDKTQTDELRAEGLAEEIIDEIVKTKEKRGMQRDEPIELRICIGDELKALLENWIDDITSEVGCTKFRFRPLDWEGDDEGTCVDLKLGDESVKIYVKESEAAA